MALPVTGAGATPRVISQTAHGSVGLSNGVATYFPDPGFIGTDTFTFAAWDGWKNSALATGAVTVAEGPYSIAVRALVPPEYVSGWPAAFTVLATLSNSIVAVTYEWDFGDGSPHETSRYASHAYSAPGAYAWTVTARAGTARASAQGMIDVGEVLRLGIAGGPPTVVSWPRSLADAVLEHAAALGAPPAWRAATNEGYASPALFNVDVTDPGAMDYFRLRQVR